MIENRHVCISQIPISAFQLDLSLLQLQISAFQLKIPVTPKITDLYLLKEISVFEMQISALNGENHKRVVIIEYCLCIAYFISTKIPISSGVPATAPISTLGALIFELDQNK